LDNVEIFKIPFEVSNLNWYYMFFKAKLKIPFEVSNSNLYYMFFTKDS